MWPSCYANNTSCEQSQVKSFSARNFDVFLRKHSMSSTRREGRGCPASYLLRVTCFLRVVYKLSSIPQFLNLLTVLNSSTQKIFKIFGHSKFYTWCVGYHFQRYFGKKTVFGPSRTKSCRKRAIFRFLVAHGVQYLFLTPKSALQVTFFHDAAVTFKTKRQSARLLGVDNYWVFIGSVHSHTSLPCMTYCLATRLHHPTARYAFFLCVCVVEEGRGRWGGKTFGNEKLECNEMKGGWCTVPFVILIAHTSDWLILLAVPLFHAVRSCCRTKSSLGIGTTHFSGIFFTFLAHLNAFIVFYQVFFRIIESFS